MHITSVDFFKDFRGAFAGAILDKASKKWTIFNDQIGNKLLLQCQNGEYWACGSQINYFSDWMKVNGFKRRISKEWENDFFSFGYMLDKYTILTGVERVFPGGDGIFDSTNLYQEFTYYAIQKRECQRTEEEAIRALDETFSQAVARAVDKCLEYQYGAVVDISGGLDSRMIAATLARINVDCKCDVIGINYAQTDSLDQIISQGVSRNLNIDLISFMMDGGNCLTQIDDLVFMNQGMNYYLGITGGKRVLSLLDRGNYGLELWGILGDVYEGGMIVEDDISTLDWNYDRFKTGNYYSNDNCYRDYPDNEIMWYYIRGILAGENTAFIRQNFMEAPAVYGDVDFLDLVFSIPYEDRVRKHIWRKWLIEKYPQMAKIRYAATGAEVTADDSEERRNILAMVGYHIKCNTRKNKIATHEKSCYTGK